MARSSEHGPLTRADMVNWLEQEIRDLSKAHELRMQEAVGFVTDYALGRTSEKEMMQRYSAYHDRWGGRCFSRKENER